MSTNIDPYCFINRNQELVELMSSAVRDLAEAEFLGERDDQNNPLPSRPLPEEQRENASGKCPKIFFQTNFIIKCSCIWVLHVPEIVGECLRWSEVVSP